MGFTGCLRLEERLLPQMTEDTVDMAQYARSLACSHTIKFRLLITLSNPVAQDPVTNISRFSHWEKGLCYSREGGVAHLPFPNRKRTVRLG